MTRFTIDRRWIAELDDEQSRELVARLCRAELVRNGCDPSIVTWGGNQRAADGGIDVDVSRVNAYGPNFVHLSSERTIIQVKAEKFGPAKINAEMKPENVVRQFFADMEENGGTYLIASTRDDCAAPTLNNRKNRMREVVEEEGFGTVKTDFLDIRRIADWVERHISIQVWIREVLGRPLHGWYSYGPWAHNETDIEAVFRMDDKPRVMPPGGKDDRDLLTLAATIEQIRRVLVNPAGNSCYLRLVGLSGVGKTRLVQALFDERIESVATLSPDQVIYTDAGVGSTPTPHEMITELGTTGEPTIVIVDNCGSEMHGQLVELAKNSGSQLRLITVEFDIRDDIPESTQCYQIQASSKELLSALLQDRYPLLSQTNTDRVAALSDGNARIAIAICETISETDNLGELRDAQLFDRLFQQRNNDSDILRRVADAISLIYSFDIADTSNSGESARLAEYADVSRREFLRNVAELKRRGLVQARGNFRALLPHALANRIANNALDNLPATEWYDNFFVHNVDRLALSFAHRLSFLHTCRVAENISNIAFSQNGFLHHVHVLSGANLKVFHYLSATNSEGALSAIEQTVANGEMLPDDLNRLLFNLAYDEDTFDRAAGLMARVSHQGAKRNNSSDPREQLSAMFQLHFSGTLAQTPQKLAFLNRLYDTSDLNRPDLGFEALDCALKFGSFTSSNVFEFGSRSRSYGWTPQTWGEVADRYAIWLEKIVDIATLQPPHAKQAREILASRFRGLWSFSLQRNTLLTAINRLIETTPWPEGYHEAQKTLRFDGDISDDPNSTPLRDLIVKLTPQDLIAQIQSNVIVANVWSEIVSEDGKPLSHEESTEIRIEVAKEMGEQAGANADVLDAIRGDVISKINGGLTTEFGLGVGRTLHSISDELDAIRTVIEARALGHASYSYSLGLIQTWHEIDPTAVHDWLDINGSDPVWRIAVPWIVAMIGVNEAQLERLLTLLSEEEPPVHSFGYHTFRQLTEILSIQEQGLLLAALSQAGETGARQALDVISLTVHGNEPIANEYGREILSILVDFPWVDMVDGNDSMDYRISKIFERIVAGFATPDDVSALIDIFDRSGDEQNWYRFNDPCKTALREMFRHFPEACIARFCTSDEDGSYNTAYELCRTFSSHREGFLEVVPDLILLNWINEVDMDQRQSRVEFVSRTCRLLERQTGGMREPTGFRSIASDLASVAINPAIILGIFADRVLGNSWSGSFANHIRLRRSFFEGLVLNNRLETRVGLEEALAYLDAKIAREQAREDQEARATAERFE